MLGKNVQDLSTGVPADGVNTLELPRPPDTRTAALLISQGDYGLLKVLVVCHVPPYPWLCSLYSTHLSKSSSLHIPATHIIQICETVTTRANIHMAYW